MSSHKPQDIQKTSHRYQLPIGIETSSIPTYVRTTLKPHPSTAQSFAGVMKSTCGELGVGLRGCNLSVDACVRIPGTWVDGCVGRRYRTDEEAAGVGPLKWPLVSDRWSGRWCRTVGVAAGVGPLEWPLVSDRCSGRWCRTAEVAAGDLVECLPERV